LAEQELEILQGSIAAVVYQNYENGYSVLRLAVGNAQTVTVVGTIPLPAVGERLMVTGKWSSHSSYGKQFEAEFLERLLPQTRQEILSYLASRAIKGIGPVMAARIVEHFGEETLLVFERQPELLAQAREEAAGLLKTATATAQQRGDEIVRQAKAEAASIKEMASADIAQEKKKVLNQIKNDISGIAMEIASKVVEREVKPSDHEDLVEQFIERLGDQT